MTDIHMTSLPENIKFMKIKMKYGLITGTKDKKQKKAGSSPANKILMQMQLSLLLPDR